MTKNNEEKTAVEIIFVIPRNQYNLMYKMNDGAEHIIRRDDAFDFFKQYLQRRNFSTLKLYLDKFLPFIILPKVDTIKTLKKKNIDYEYQRNKLYIEIENVAKTFKREDTNKESQWDTMVDSIIKKYEKSFTIE